MVSDVSGTFFERAMVPVANETNASAVTSAIAPYVDDPSSTVVAVHVIEKAGGALDKASVEQRELAAEDIFAVVEDGLGDTAAGLETEIRYGTDVADTIVDAAHDIEASAIVFTPRGGSRWKKWLSGDTTHDLLETSDVPVVVVPDGADRDA